MILTRVAELAGQWQYFKGKSQIYTDAVRSWITPAAAAGGLAKYLGLQSRWAILVVIALPMLVEIGGYVLGRFLYHHGGVEKEYQLAMDRDPFKRESLRLAGIIASELRLLRSVVVGFYRRLNPSEPK